MPTPEIETDPRFPSGKWIGFYLMPHTGAKRHQTELTLSFAGGKMSGQGRDQVGKFVCEGRYDVADGRAVWMKRYIGKHDVYYQGYNEGKGIWGVWTIPDPIPSKGGFHIWPEYMGDLSLPSLTEEADTPVEKKVDAPPEPVLTPV